MKKHIQILVFLAMVVAGFGAKAQSGIITSIAGNGYYNFGGDGGAATMAALANPYNVCTDAAGNVYIADAGNNRIRKVSATGIISSIAGSGPYGGYSGDGGAATAAVLNNPSGVAVDAAGNIYIADQGNNCIRKVNTSGIISTFAGHGISSSGIGDGGPATNATFWVPIGVAVDSRGNVYIADCDNDRIRKVDTSGFINTVAGSSSEGFGGDGGPATAAVLNHPWSVAIDNSGNFYIADCLNNRVRKVDTNGIISTFAGAYYSGMGGDGGPATDAAMSNPYGVAADSSGNIYISDGGNWRIRKVNTAGIINTVAGGTSATYSGDGGPATAAGLMVFGVATDIYGNFFITDRSSFRVRKVNPAGIISTIAGDGMTHYSGDGGVATTAEIYSPTGIALDNSGNVIFADMYNNLIRKRDVYGIATAIGGNSTAGFSGDGGPATAAQIDMLYSGGVATDTAGNIYIADTYNSRIRKINAAGIITTVAGNGTTTGVGDGGPATAASLYDPENVTVDVNGNIYISETSGYSVRKVNTSGIITTIAGTGIGGHTGDGGPATAAELDGPTSVAVDAIGDVFIASSSLIRKVDPSGIITTIAGGGYSSLGFGDGGVATDAWLYNVTGVAVDAMGNVFIADQNDHRIRKVNTAGIISSIAGTVYGGFTGDGGSATAAQLNHPYGITVDRLENVYISDYANNRLRKISSSPDFTSDSLSVFVDNDCSGLIFYLITKSYSAGQYVKTYFGDGTSFDTITSAYGTNGIAGFNRGYSSSGVFTIKHVLYNGSVAIDSITYSHTVSLCQNFSLAFYYDALGTCVYNDSADCLFPNPILVGVDSNGVTIDTVSVTSGLIYTAYGNPGDIYTFRVTSVPGNFYSSCPFSDTISDTLFTGSNETKYWGFRCSSSTSFDLAEHMGNITGRHMQKLNIDISNAYCTHEAATVTLTFSPLFVFASAIPPPVSVAGNIATWSIGELSLLNSPQNILVTLSTPTPLIESTWLTPGDTAMTQSQVTPIVGDTDTTNNVVVQVGTVNGSWDPNEMSVSPSGCIYSDTATTLQYTVLFENTGNDTAHNIYVMDTLSDNLDPKSLRIVSASNTMNISKWYDSIHHNIYKFEFPHINLLDSSHHNRCDGMFIYTIKTKAGLPTGTTIFNHAGIFFDDNAVVMTDTTENVMNCPLSVNRSALPALSLSLYPNPASSELTIHTPGNNYSSFIITNLMGQQMLQQVIPTSETKVNIAAFPAGVYFVTFKGEGGEVVKKFVKM